MGVGGTLEYFSGLLGNGHSRYHKRKPLQTVELQVKNMDCDGCELKVRNAVSSMRGVQSVDINRKMHKVTVIGYVEAQKVLKKVQGTGKTAVIWPFVAYNLVTQPYGAQTYDKKAPPGYVRIVETSAQTSLIQSRRDDQYNLFSDENPNACSIM